MYFPLIVISGPSASGKNVIVGALEKKIPVRRMVTTTTRKKRHGEKNHIDYHFVTPQKFSQLKKRKELFEHARVHGIEYGVTKEEIAQARRKKKFPILVIDVQGGQRVKNINPQTLLVFIRPTPLHQYYARLLKDRGHEINFAKRLLSIKKEIRASKNYERVVRNQEGKLRETTRNIERILRDYIKKYEQGALVDNERNLSYSKSPSNI